MRVYGVMWGGAVILTDNKAVQGKKKKETKITKQNKNKKKCSKAVTFMQLLI